VLARRAVLVTDFTVPESPQSEGDGKNLAPLPHRLRCCADRLLAIVAFLPPSSFGSRYGANNKPLPRKASCDLTKLRSSLLANFMAQAPEFMHACAKWRLSMNDQLR
jgi:hypothetical protein